MNTQHSDLDQRIGQLNQFSVVQYLTLLGHKPTYKTDDFTVYDIPQENSPYTSVVINNTTNRFRLTMEIYHGTVLDLASVLFRPEPAEIVNDLAPYHLDGLAAAENNPTSEPSFKSVEDAEANDRN